MREVTFDQWCDYITTAGVESGGRLRHSYFRADGSDAMEYVLGGKPIARADGYTTGHKRYYISTEQPS